MVPCLSFHFSGSPFIWMWWECPVGDHSISLYSWSCSSYVITDILCSFYTVTKQPMNLANTLHIFGILGKDWLQFKSKSENEEFCPAVMWKLTSVFRRMYCLHLQGWTMNWARNQYGAGRKQRSTCHLLSCSIYCLTLRMEAICSYKKWFTNNRLHDVIC